MMTHGKWTMHRGIQENGKKDSLVSERFVLDSGASCYRVYLLILHNT